MKLRLPGWEDRQVPLPLSHLASTLLAFSLTVTQAAGTKLMTPVSAPQVLGLQACATTPSSGKDPS